MPEELAPQSFYEPGSYGFEKELKKRIDFFERLKKETKSFS